MRINLKYSQYMCIYTLLIHPIFIFINTGCPLETGTSVFRLEINIFRVRYAPESLKLYVCLEHTSGVLYMYIYCMYKKIKNLVKYAKINEKWGGRNFY